MSIKDKRPEYAETFGREQSIHQGAIASCESNYSLTRLKSQYSGNKCGHLPSEPASAVLPFHHKKLPDLLEKLKDRLFSFYFAPKKYLSRLAFLPKERQRRSERREAIKAVCEALLHYTQLDTLSIGKRLPQGEIKPLSLIQIAKFACLEIRRTKRALADLIKAGYLKTQRRFSAKAEGGFIGHHSLRYLTLAFFQDLGISHAMLELRQHWKRKREAVERAKRSGYHQHMTVRLHAIRSKRSAPALSSVPEFPPSPPTIQPRARDSFEEGKRKAAQALELLKQGYTLEEIKKLVY